MLDLTDPDDESPQWRGAGTTSMRRHLSSGVLVPDGSVIVTGGSMRGYDGDPNPAGGINERYFTVYTTDLFDPDTETWCRLADVPALPDSDEELPTLRGYHSMSYLLRDGRIYLGAGGYTSSVDNHFNYQLYYPPYLFRGPRPEIDVGATVVSGYPDVPPGMQTGSTFTISRENQVPVERVTMITQAVIQVRWGTRFNRSTCEGPTQLGQTSASFKCSDAPMRRPLTMRTWGLPPRTFGPEVSIDRRRGGRA